MATKATTTVVANKTAIDQAVAKNKANEAAKVVAQQKADAAQAKVQTTYKASVAPAVTSINSAIQALMKNLNSPSGKITASTQKAIADSTAAIKNISPEVQNALKTATTDYNTAMADVKTFSQTFDVPAEVYQEVLGTSGKMILKAKLQELGIPEKMIDSSITFVDSLVNDGVGYDEAVDIYYNNKDFTTKEGSVVESPFYKEFTYLREYAPKTGAVPSPLELMQFKLGVQNFVTKGDISAQYGSEESIQKYIANSVRITDLDKRVVEAKVAAASADPNKVKTLQAMGYIKDGQGLTDFFLDANIGQQQFEINKNTAAFASQAIARSQYGLTVDPERMKALAAQAGYSTAADSQQVEAQAAKIFETVGQELMPTTKLSQIYQNAGAQATTEAQQVANTQLQKTIQTELENEAVLGMASERRKKLSEQEQLAFQAKSGLASTALSRGTTSGLI